MNIITMYTAISNALTRSALNYNWFKAQFSAGRLPDCCTLGTIGNGMGTGFLIHIKSTIDVDISVICPVDAIMFGRTVTELALKVGDDIKYCDEAGFDDVWSTSDNEEALAMVIKVAEMAKAGTLKFD